MSKRSASILSALLAASGLSATSASGALVTFNFAGTVDFASAPAGPLAGVTAGTPFSGQYTFDTDAFDINSSTALAQYYSYGAGISYSATVGGVTFSRGSPLEIDVENNNGSEDGYFVNSQGDVSPSTTIPGGAFFTSGIFLIDHTASALSSEALLLSPPTLAAYDTNLFFVTIFPAGGGSPVVDIQGTVTSITPEPANLAAGALGLSLIRRRRA